MHELRLRQLLFVNTICACFAVVMSTQGESDYGGVVRGKIVQAGEPIPNIKVTLEDEPDQQYAPVFTDRAGMFVINGVKAGKYKLLVSPPGDQPSRTQITAGPDLTNLSPIELTGRMNAPRASFDLNSPPVSSSSITPMKPARS